MECKWPQDALLRFLDTIIHPAPQTRTHKNFFFSTVKIYAVAPKAVQVIVGKWLERQSIEAEIVQKNEKTCPIGAREMSGDSLTFRKYDFRNVVYVTNETKNIFLYR